MLKWRDPSFPPLIRRSSPSRNLRVSLILFKGNAQLQQSKGLLCWRAQSAEAPTCAEEEHPSCSAAACLCGRSRGGRETGAENQMHWRGFLTRITRSGLVVKLPPDTGQALLLLRALSVARLQCLERKPIFSSSALGRGSSKSGGSCRTGVHEMAKEMLRMQIILVARSMNWKCLRMLTGKGLLRADSDGASGRAGARQLWVWLGAGRVRMCQHRADSHQQHCADGHQHELVHCRSMGTRPHLPSFHLTPPCSDVLPQLRGCFLALNVSRELVGEQDLHWTGHLKPPAPGGLCPHTSILTYASVLLSVSNEEKNNQTKNNKTKEEPSLLPAFPYGQI